MDKEKIQALITELELCANRELAYTLLKQKVSTKKELIAICKAIFIPLNTQNKEDLEHAIIENTAGLMLRRKAMLGKQSLDS
jgi:hypothetical protein